MYCLYCIIVLLCITFTWYTPYYVNVKWIKTEGLERSRLNGHWSRLYSFTIGQAIDESSMLQPTTIQASSNCSIFIAGQSSNDHQSISSSNFTLEWNWTINFTTSSTHAMAITGHSGSLCRKTWDHFMGFNFTIKGQHYLLFYSQHQWMWTTLQFQFQFRCRCRLQYTNWDGMDSHSCQMPMHDPINTPAEDH